MQEQTARHFCIFRAASLGSQENPKTAMQLGQKKVLKAKSPNLGPCTILNETGEKSDLQCGHFAFGSDTELSSFYCFIVVD